MVRHFNFSPVFCPSDKVKSPQSLGRLFSICKIKPEKTTHQRSRRKRDARKGTPPEPQRWGKRQLLGRADDTRPRLCHYDSLPPPSKDKRSVQDDGRLGRLATCCTRDRATERGTSRDDDDGWLGRLTAGPMSQEKGRVADESNFDR